MKKVVIVVLIILLFAGLSVGVTFALIQERNNENINKNQNQTNEISCNLTNKISNNTVNETTNNNTKIDNLSEKTIDLSGTYSQNDLTIEKINYEGTNSKIKMPEYGNDEDFLRVPQISGLKNKQVENKINEQIKKSIDDKIENMLKNDNIKEFYFSYDISANFANVLSVTFEINMNDYKEYDTIRLNYKLTNGETLKFEELFRQDEDLRSILRLALYKGLAREQRNESSGQRPDKVYDIYYDNEKEGWYATYSEHDENGNIKEEIREYTPPMTEYEIEKLIKKFLKQEDKEFSFSPSNLKIKLDDGTYFLEFKEIADKVVIYNKFLTTESLYEKNDIGVKSIIICSAETNFGKYKETKYESDNFFYDICLQPNDQRGYKVENKYKFLEEKIENAKIEMNNKVEEYKKIANDNLNKAYFLFLEFKFSEDFDEELVGEFRNKLIVCDLKDKEQMLEVLLSCYRYYNVNYVRYNI